MRIQLVVWNHSQHWLWKAKRSDTFKFSFLQGLGHFCSLIMSDCGENGVSVSGIDWVEEFYFMRAEEPFCIVWKPVDGQRFGNDTFPKTIPLFFSFANWIERRGCIIYHYHRCGEVFIRAEKEYYLMELWVHSPA